MMQLTISSNVNKLAAELSTAKVRAMHTTTLWVVRLTRYAEQKMKYHVPSRTKRATGKLKESISSEVSIKGYSAEGIAYVPSSMGIYQYVVEGGRKGAGRRIRGRMSFPVDHWKKGSSNPSISKLAFNGRFVFIAEKSGIKMGDYKGNHFVQKSNQDLVNFYNYHQEQIRKNFEGSLFITTSVV
jgi:hypothetical protein